MSVNVEVHNAVSIKIEDVTRSGTTTWRASTSLKRTAGLFLLPSLHRLVQIPFP
jgi:hypothetical protein